MSENFNRKTFEYFESAGKNRKNLKWFEKNKELYEENVKAPFTYLIKKMDLALGSQFPGIPVLPRKMSQPFYREEFIPEDGTVVKNKCSAFLSEKSGSKFEWNPGLYLTLSSEENIMGHGLYRPSSRQMKLLRAHIMKDPAQISRLMKFGKFREAWGELQGEKFIRFPKDFNADEKGAEFLWHKQFYFQKSLTRKAVLDRNFSEHVIQDFKLAAPYISWMRETVGVYIREEAG
ncbi:MAG: DUF2461 family protein [Bdellovibrionota bacterium]